MYDEEKALASRVREEFKQNLRVIKTLGSGLEI